MRKVRLGKFRMLFGEPVPAIIKQELRNVSLEYQQRLCDYLVELRKCIKKLHDMLRVDVDYIVKQADLKEISVVEYDSSCHRKTCMTCLGEKDYHYPYFKYSLRKPIVVEERWTGGGRTLESFLTAKKRRTCWKNLRQEQLKDFLTGIGLTREEIASFKSVRDLREQYIQIYHTLILVSNYSGLSDLSLEEERTEEEQTHA